MAYRLDGNFHRAGLLDDLAPHYFAAMLDLCPVAALAEDRFSHRVMSYGNSRHSLKQSFKRGALSPEQEKEVLAALEIAARPQPPGEPLNWFETGQPRKWHPMVSLQEFNWKINPIEKTKFFRNVVFTNGHLVDGDTRTVHYGVWTA